MVERDRCGKPLLLLLTTSFYFPPPPPKIEEQTKQHKNHQFILSHTNHEIKRKEEQTKQHKNHQFILSHTTNSKKPDARLLLGQTETWTEYSRDGRVVKGAPRAVMRSKYEEDVQINNHTTVWGSFFDKRSGKWGYGCCHSVIKQSYCTGMEGRKVNEEYSAALLSAGGGTRKRDEEEEEEEEEGGKEAEKEKKQKKKSKLSGEMTTRSELYGTEAGITALELDAAKLKEAVKRQKAFQRERVEADDRKRGYNVKGEGEGGSGEVTKEDMEAYRLVRTHGEDPMAKVGSDELLE